MTLKTLSTLAFLFIFSFGFGQTLVKDFYEGFDGSQPSSLFAHGEYIYFTANHEIYGREIFRIHKETDEFQVVHEFFEGENGLYRVDAFFNIGDIVYAFVTSSEGSGLYQLVDEESINVEEIIQLDGFFYSFAVVGEELYYFTVDRDTEALQRLWYIAQMPNEAKMMRAFPSTANPRNLTAYKEQLFMILDDGIHGREIWQSDGSEVTFLGDVDVTHGVYELTKFKDHLYFRADDGIHGHELWQTDGTTQGTKLAANISATQRSFPRNLTVSGSYLYFAAHYAGIGVELTRFDGISAELVRDINHHQYRSSSPRNLVDVDGTLFFAADSKTGNNYNDFELWRSDGTHVGTYQVKEIHTSGSSMDFAKMLNVEGTLYFTALDDENIEQLWKSEKDGTTEKVFGTITQKPIGDITQLVALNNYCYLVGKSGNNGQEIWKVDDVEQTQVTALRESYSNGVGYMEAHIHKDELYFIDGSVNLWKTDGTEGGSMLVANPRTVYRYRRSGMVSLGDNFYYNIGFDLWKSNGQNYGTVRVYGGATNPGDFVYLKKANTIIFSADRHQDRNRELWRMNSYENGSELIKEINPNGASSPHSFYATDDYVLFFANDGIHGAELWRTDGTTAGTYLLKDINPSEASTFSRGVEFIRLGNYYYFSAYSKEFGSELWRTDGTAAGTSMVKDINVGEYSGISSRIVKSNGILYFSGSTRRTNSELWRSDGTSEGTYKLKEVRPGNKGSNINALLGLEHMLYFTASSENNIAELWKSDGSTEGTTLVKVLDRGFNANRPYRLIPLTDNTFVFDHKNDSYGYEIWVSDGTEQGTYALCDIYSEEQSSHVNNFFAYNNKLFFTAEDGIHGREIWIIPFNICEDNSIEFKDLTQGGIYQATDQITLSEKTADRSSVIVKAGYEIVFEEGFETADDGWLTASIEECVEEEDAIVVEEREEEIEQLMEQPKLVCFPNPAHDLITIQYQLPTAQNVSVELYSVLGNRVKVLENAIKMEGQHQLEVQTNQIEAGNYFVLLRAKDRMEVQQIVVVK
ncbi:MAG: T9SS type A sorting domain-containing protein [Bacteroidota bacterium]